MADEAAARAAVVLELNRDRARRGLPPSIRCASAEADRRPVAVAPAAEDRRPWAFGQVTVGALPQHWGSGKFVLGIAFAGLDNAGYYTLTRSAAQALTGLYYNASHLPDWEAWTAPHVQEATGHQLAAAPEPVARAAEQAAANQPLPHQ